MKKNYKRILIILVLIFIWAFSFITVYGQNTVININGAVEYQVIDGFGGSESWRLPKTSSMYSTLFDDLGASILRFQMFAYTESLPDQLGDEARDNDNNDPFAIDWNNVSTGVIDSFTPLIKAANSGGVTVIATTWSPPAWMKQSNLVEDSSDFIAGYEDEVVEFIIIWLKGLEQRGAYVDYVTIQNEPDNLPPWPGCKYTSSQIVDIVKRLGARIQQENLSTKVYATDTTHLGSTLTNYFGAICNDSVAKNYVDFLATHPYGTEFYPVDNAIPNWTSAANFTNNCGKNLWQTEFAGKGNESTWTHAFEQIQHLHNALFYGQVNAWLTYELYDNRDIGHGTIDAGGPHPKFYTLKQYYKYVRPGAIRIDTQSGDNDVLVTSFKHNSDNTVTIVAINRKTSAESVGFNFSNISGLSNLDVIRTSATENSVNLGQVAVSNNSFTYNLPAESVTTFTGTMGGGVPTDTTPPTITSFDAQPRTTTDTTTVSWTVTDNQGLKRIEVWRTTDNNGQPDSNNWAQIYTELAAGIIDTGNYPDTPTLGTYWYGIHALDTADNLRTENAPIRVVLTSTQLPLSPKPGIYSFFNKNRFNWSNSDDANMDELTYNFIDGATFAVTWADCEPSEDNYDWSLIDRVVSKATVNNKKVNIALFTTGYFPNWLSNKNGFQTFSTTYTHSGQNVVLALPWNIIYKQHFYDFIGELGRRYNNNSNIQYIAISGAGVINNGAETTQSLPSVNFLSKFSELKNLGFSEAVMIQTWQDFIDEYVRAFPNKYLTLYPHLSYPDNATSSSDWNSALAINLMNYTVGKYGNRIIFINTFGNANGWWDNMTQRILNNNISAETDRLVNHMITLKGQTIIGRQVDRWSEAGDYTVITKIGSLGKALSNAHNLSMQIIEIWAEDIMTPWAPNDTSTEKSCWDEIQIAHQCFGQNNVSDCNLLNNYSQIQYSSTINGCTEVQPPYIFCGDNTCNGAETCSSCPQDCGICPDTIPPTITSFDVQPRNTTITAIVSWSATDNQELSQVEVWRTTDLSGQPDSGNWTQIHTKAVSGITDTGQYLDTPFVGTYWYGIHVVDTTGNIGTENSPIQVVVTGTQPPPPTCGDNSCNGIETCSTCPQDCGACPPPTPFCGDNSCNGIETCSTCPGDCGSCPPPPPTCGDRFCNGFETCFSCPSDCGSCPPPPPPPDIIPPVVTSFDVQPRNTTGSVTITWNVTENVNLYKTEVWRTTDNNGQPDSNNWIQIYYKSATRITDTGQYLDTPFVGTYWYGIHAIDLAGNVGIEGSSISATITIPQPPPPICGDNDCNGTETCSTCPQDCGTCPPPPDTIPPPTDDDKLENPLDSDDLGELISRAGGLLRPIAISLGIIMIIWGGVVTITSVGSEERLKKGKRILIFSLIGTAIVFLSSFIIDLVKEWFSDL